MIKILYCSVLMFMVCQPIWGQTTIFGYIKGQNDKPLQYAEVKLDEDTEVGSDNMGYFQFKQVKEGTHTITIEKIGHTTINITFTISSEERRKNLGDFKMEYNPSIEAGFMSLTDDDLVADTPSSEQTGISLLQSSRDVFSKIASYELGAYWFRARGIDNRYNNIMFNGIPVAKAYSGRADFSNWGGLSNVIKRPYELTENNNVSDYTFSNLGGTVYYDTRASSYRKGLTLSYAQTNRSYNQRLMLTYATGMLPSGWALAVSGSRSWADDAKIDGVYNNTYSYFVSAEKKISDNHRINFTTFGSPARKAGSSPNTQEVYDLRGKDYNAYWGWQSGDKRNERVKKIFEPMFMFSHYWKINSKTKLTTSASYQFGYNKSSRLNWYNSENPSPTYYKNLPSYLNQLIEKARNEGNPTDALEQAYRELLEGWQNNNLEITQLDWNSLYQANQNAPQITDPYTGEKGRRASYFLVNDVIKDKTLNLSTHLQTHLEDNWKFYLNLNYQKLVEDNYREVADLLGADFVLNQSAFLQDNGNHENDYNVLRSGSVARKGDKTEYFYKMYRQGVTANAVTSLDINRWKFSVSALLGWNESYRDGKFLNGLYAEDSYGKSRKQNFTELGFRGNIIYKINGRNYLTVNSSYFELSPTLNEIFANARLNNYITPEIENQKINSNDINYILQAPKIKARITGYYTKIKDAVKISRYYTQGLDLSQYLPSSGSTVNPNTESSNSFVSEILTGMEKDYLGMELGIEWKATPTITANVVAALGQYVYKNNPNLFILTDSYEGFPNFGTSYIKDYKIAGTPQKSYSAGIKYTSPKYWWIGVSGNFLQDIYSDISALARTKNFTVNPDTKQPYADATADRTRELLKQKKYDDIFMFNANVGKFFRLGKYNMGVIFSVNNIFNQRNYVNMSFEQGRYANFKDLDFDKSLSSPVFGDKIFYDRGRSYFLNIYVKL